MRNSPAIECETQGRSMWPQDLPAAAFHDMMPVRDPPGGLESIAWLAALCGTLQGILSNTAPCSLLLSLMHPDRAGSTMCQYPPL